MKTADITRIFQAATVELAGRYNLPELLTREAQVKASVKIDETISLEVDIVPQGQFAAIVRSATATVDFAMAKDSKELGYLRLRLSYQHHGGGSNGSDQRFITFNRSSFGQAEYEGMIPEHLYRNVQQAEFEMRAKVAEREASQI